MKPARVWLLPPRNQVALLLTVVLLRPATGQLPAEVGLRIIVLKGQDALNDLRSKTAVAPLVEVRDERGQPVAGTEVTFRLPEVGPGGAFHGWMRAQTVKTDALGQAGASGFVPNGEAGRFEIRVTAVSEARTAAAVIIQTNVHPDVAAPAAAPPSRIRRAPLFAAVILLVTSGASLTLILRGRRSAWSWLAVATAVGPILMAISVLRTRAKREGDQFATSSGAVRMTPIHHASLMIQAKGTVIHVDPISEANYDQRPRADLILITDVQADHLDPGLLPHLSKKSTVIYGPEAAAKSVSNVTVIRNGEARAWGPWKIEAVPAYNLPRGDAPGQVFHEKGRGNGYVLTFGNKRFYLSGNTGDTPEMHALRDIDVAFISMNPPYTMSAEEAATAVRAFKPKVVYPYHYRGSLLSIFQFKKELAGTDVDVRVRNWYR